MERTGVGMDLELRTQRLLLREGYRVVLAKDGLDALELPARHVEQSGAHTNICSLRLRG